MKILNMAATICLAFAMVTAAKWWWSFYSDPRFNRKVNEKVKEKLAYPKEKLDQTYVWLKAQIKAQLEGTISLVFFSFFCQNSGLIFGEKFENGTF